MVAQYVRGVDDHLCRDLWCGQPRVAQYRQHPVNHRAGDRTDPHMPGSSGPNLGHFARGIAQFPLNPLRPLRQR